MISDTIPKTISMYWDGGQTMIPPFDQLVVVWLLLVVVLGGMRLFYGAWPWEASKTWYRTRQAVAYVESLGADKKATPALRLTEDAEDTRTKGTTRDEEQPSTAGLMKDVAEATATLRQLLNSVRDDSSDTYDRSLAFDNSAPKVTPQSLEMVTPSAKEDSEKQPLKRRSSGRKKPIQATETVL